MLLQPNTFLYQGKYRILKSLGQGGFGITYLAEQMAGPDTAVRKVAVKEFFMKDYCDRQGDQTQVTLGTQGNRDMVERYKQKFLKEARTIAQFQHPNIVQVYDVFMENNTAYYVMEYLDGQTLTDLVQAQGPMPEQVALPYFDKLISAVACIHDHQVNHLDIKPSNVMLRSNGEPVLIDFGLAKNYDRESGGQTSTTPVGISEGFSPPEQYNAGGVSSFSPASDIYALGATFYYMLSGLVPTPSTNILNDGLQPLPSYISINVQTAVGAAMRLRRDDRPNIQQLMSLLHPGQDDEDQVVQEVEGEVVSVEPMDGYSAPMMEQRPRSNRTVLYVILGLLALGLIAFVAVLLLRGPRGVVEEKSDTLESFDTTEVAVACPVEHHSILFVADGRSPQILPHS